MEKSIALEATLENLDQINAFIESELEAVGCSMKYVMQINLAVEEIYVNIVHYAYSQKDSDGNIIPDTGTGPMECRIDADESRVVLTFIDEGTKYDPLKKEDPDTTLSAEERNIGGLGIFMVKKTMDDMSYRYEDGKNILTMTKNIT